MRGDRRVHLVDHLLDAFQKRAGHELVGIVFAESDARAIVLINAAREIVRDLDHAADEAGPQIVERAGKGIVIVDMERFADPRRCRQTFRGRCAIRAVRS